MKRIIIAAAFACLAFPAFAADPPPAPAKPTIEQLELQVKQLQAMVTVLRQQRDSAFQQANDVYVDQAVQAVTPPAQPPGK